MSAGAPADSSGDALTVGLIWAQARGGVIGRGGVMPWHLPEDLAHFKEVTLTGPVVMGRRTWESIPERFRPLPGRRNIVVTRRLDWSADGAEVAGSVDDAIAIATDAAAAGLASDVAAAPARVWIIGGGELYAETIDRADVLEVTEIDLDVEGDTVAPGIDGSWQAASATDWRTSRTGLRYRFVTYVTSWRADAERARPV